MNFLLLSIRNLQHNYRRALTVATFVFVSVLVFLLLNAAVTTAQQTVDRAVVNSLLGHVQIRPNIEDPTPVIDMSADWGAPDHLSPQETEDVLTAARANDDTVAAYPLIRTNMLVTADDPSVTTGVQVPSVAVGVTNGADEYTDNLILESGSYLQFSDTYEAVLSTGVAGQLGVKVGEVVTLLGQDINGDPTQVEAHVVGIGNAQSLSGFEARLSYLTFPAAAELKGLDENAASDVIAFGSDIQRSSSLASEIEATVGEDFLVSNWTTQGGYISAINLAYTGVFYIFLAVILLIACILIVNMVSLAGIERTQEIATLRAIGFDRTRIVVIFLVEVLVAAVAGAVVAYLLAAAIGLPLSSVTFDMGPPADAVVGKSFTLDYSLLRGLPGVLTILGLVALATLRPSFRAASRNAAEALVEQ